MATSIFRISEANFQRITEDGRLRIIELTLGDPVPPPTTMVRGDILKVWNSDGSYADWVQNGAYLQSGADLDTAVFNSLFSDRLAHDDDILPGGGSNRRGWWGDAYSDVPIGSRLYLLDRAKLTAATPLACKGYIKEAMQWFIDDGVAIAINIATILQLPNALAARIELVQKSGLKFATSYAWVWKEVT